MTVLINHFEDSSWLLVIANLALIFKLATLQAYCSPSYFDLLQFLVKICSKQAHAAEYLKVRSIELADS